MRLATAIAALLFAVPAAAQTVSVVETEGAVTSVVQTPRGSYIETERGTLRLEPGACDGGLCLVGDVIRGLPERAPEGALPDGSIATAASGDIRSAWYGQPTDRYAHGVLGDAIEGGSLVVATADGTQEEFILPENQVFEDITPRIHDLDGALVEVAALSENGRPNRWLNIAAIVPSDIAGESGGGSTIIGVRTPHIGGRLFFLTIGADGSVRERNDIDRNMSNHLIGSRELGLSAVVETARGAELFIPSQDRRSLRPVFGRGSAIALPGAVDKAIIALEGKLVTATDDGRLLVITP